MMAEETFPVLVHLNISDRMALDALADEQKTSRAELVRSLIRIAAEGLQTQPPQPAAVSNSI